MQAAIRLSHSFLPHREALAMNALAAVMLWCDQAHPRTQRSQMDPRVREAIDRMCDRLHEPIQVGEVAESVGLSISRFSHLFAEQVGRPPQAFLEQQRMTRARQLLERESIPIGEIARRVGYEDPLYFSRRFRGAIGMSPSAYRRQHQPG
ncbi:MAG: helix-turn-helix domain-containing protein [Phycisphaeraceae bacterium]|nr:helix-turn-helix domain-containing protein [Phycisphaeraceae bacterium]